MLWFITTAHKYINFVLKFSDVQVCTRQGPIADCGLQLQQITAFANTSDENDEAMLFVLYTTTGVHDVANTGVFFASVMLHEGCALHVFFLFIPRSTFAEVLCYSTALLFASTSSLYCTLTWITLKIKPH